MRFAFVGSLILAACSAADAFKPTGTHRRVDVSVAHRGLHSHLHQAGEAAEPAALPQPRTNAARLALGLPPLPPKRRNSLLHPAPARRSAVPGLVKKCNIHVTSSNGFQLGYISATADSGRYGLQPSQDSSLEVSFTFGDGYPTSKLSLKTTNGLANYPYFGAGVGQHSTSKDLDGEGSYAVIGGTSETNSGSPPGYPGCADSTSTAIESAIWSVDLSSGALIPYWTNTDGSSHAVAIQIAHISNTLDYFLLTRPTSGIHVFGGQLIDQVSFTCVGPGFQYTNPTPEPIVVESQDNGAPDPVID